MKESDLTPGTPETPRMPRGEESVLKRLLVLTPLLVLQILQVQQIVSVAATETLPGRGTGAGAKAGSGAGQSSSSADNKTRFMAQTPPDVLEDASLSVPKLLRKYGYPVENHVVMTDDGYVLTIHRVPHAGRRYSPQAAPQSPVSSKSPVDPLSESNDKINEDINSNRVRSIRDHHAARSRSRSRMSKRWSTFGRRLPRHPEETTNRQRTGAERSRSRRAVLLLPGMMCSSAVFLVMGPRHGLGYLLADAGYDVWMANPRGVRYSMGHVEIPPTDDKYWQFSWHEMGKYDVPAILDYIIDVTGEDKIPVVGHSMGTTVMMVMGSERPDYNSKVSVHIALAPTAYLQHAQSPVLKGLAALVPTVSTLTDMLGMHGIRPTPPLNEALKQMCRDEAVVTQRFCKNSAFMLLGFDPEQLNATMFPVIMGHFPSGGSTRILLHYMQSFTKGDFRQYDHGTKRNMLHYGQPTPPAYNLSKVSFPTALLTGENDWVDSMEDVERMAKELPNVVDFYRVPWPKFNHMDHVFAIDAKELEYDHVMDVLKRFA